MISTDVALEVRSLGKTYQGYGRVVEAIRELTFAVDRGEFVCIVGPSGAGKTTLLRCLSGLLRPSTGTVYFGDTAVTAPLAEIAVVFQDYRGSLMPWMTVRENVAFPLQGMGVKRAERRERAARSL